MEHNCVFTNAFKTNACITNSLSITNKLMENSFITNAFKTNSIITNSPQQTPL